MDLWDTAIVLEARRHIVPPEIRHSRLGRSAEYFCIPVGPAAHFSHYRSVVFWLCPPVGRGKMAFHLAAHGAVFHRRDRKSTRLNSSHLGISYAVFCLHKQTQENDYRSAKCA